MIFDYSKNRIGFSQKKLNVDNSIDILFIIRIVFLVIIACCGITIAYNPCKKIIRIARAKQFVRSHSEKYGKYEPVYQTPYEDLKNRLRDELNNT